MAGFKRPQHSLIALGVVLTGALSSVRCSSTSTSPTVSEAPEPSTTTAVEATSDDVSTTSLDPTTTTVEVTTTSVVIDETEERLIAIIDNYLASTQAPGVTMTVLRPSDDGTDTVEAVNLARGVRSLTTEAELSTSD